MIYCYYAFMINKYCVYYIRTGCKKSLGKVRKFGRIVHTLIHPPSQCGCCVEQVDLINALVKLYEKPSESNKVFFMKRLFNMKMLEGGSIANHLNDFNTVTNQLSYVGVNFDDEVRALLILCSLPKRWDGLVMDVSNFVSGSSILKFDDAIGVILRKEMRRKSTGETLGNALTIEARGRQRERGKSPGNRWKSRKGRSKSRARVECWNCGKKGHFKKDCRSRNVKQGDRQQENK